MARTPGPSFRALLFGCGGGAVLGQTAAFLVGSGGDVRQVGAVARRPHPSLRALLFRCGERALCEPWRLEDRSWRPWPAGPVRPSRPCCFGMAIAPCVSFGGWKTGQTASFLVGSESNVHIGTCCGVTGFGYGPGMERVWIGVWIRTPCFFSSTRARQSRNRRSCSHSTTRSTIST